MKYCRGRCWGCLACSSQSTKNWLLLVWHRNVPGAFILLFILCFEKDSSPPYTRLDCHQSLIKREIRSWFTVGGRKRNHNSSLPSSKWPQDSTQQSTTCSACLMLWWTHILLLGLSQHTPHLHFNSLCMWQTQWQPQPAENWPLILQHRAAAQLLEEQPRISIKWKFFCLCSSYGWKQNVSV